MKDIWDFIFVLVVVCLPCSCIGNHVGDQATLRDCATKGDAKMMGGGVIKCEVVREVKP